MARPVELREISSEEGNQLLRMVRRGAGNIVTWRRAQIVLWAAQGYRVSRIAEIGFTSEDRVREVIHNFNRDAFSSLSPKYAGGRPHKFDAATRAEIARVALCQPKTLGKPYTRWSLTKLADSLVEAGVVDDISTESIRRTKKGCRISGSRRGRNPTTPTTKPKRTWCGPWSMTRHRGVG